MDDNIYAKYRAFIKKHKDLIKSLHEKELINEELKKKARSLNERIKELDCLYTISSLIDKSRSLDEFLQSTVEAIPEAMQYPDRACAKIILDNRRFLTLNYMETEGVVRSEIIVNNIQSGFLEVCYLGMVETGADIFLRDEIRLINEIAFQLGNTVSKYIAENSLREARYDLENKNRNLEEMNTALRVLLKHQGEEKKDFENGIIEGLDVLVYPYINKMKSITIDEEQQMYLGIIERNLGEITKGFIRNLASALMILTPTEIRITRLITDEESTKSIAKIMNTSESTVNFHRRNIRRKLGLTGKGANLVSHLQSLYMKG